MTSADGEIAIGGDYTLTNQRGETVSSSDFRGKYQLVFFGFTHCPDICPTTLTTITQSLNTLGDKAKDFVPVLITVDPARDTPEVMAEYAKAFHPSLQALTGPQEKITEISKAFGVYAAKAEPEDKQMASMEDHEHHNSDAMPPSSYNVDHTGIVYVMDRNGAYVDHFSYDVSPAEMTARLNKLLDENADSAL